MARPGTLPPAAAMVAKHLPRTAIALPIIWHGVTLARSWHQRKTESRFWLVLDVIGTGWSLLPVAKELLSSRRAEASIYTILRKW